MTKLYKVIRWCNNRKTFTWKEFMKGKTYPCTESNYLSLLVSAGYVKKDGRGLYTCWLTIPGNITLSQLKKDLYIIKQENTYDV